MPIVRMTSRTWGQVVAVLANPADNLLELTDGVGVSSGSEGRAPPSIADSGWASSLTT